MRLRSRRALNAGRRVPVPSGAVLLEVIVALTILTTAAVLVVALTAESERAIGRARAADRELRAAGAFFNAVALWPRADLDRHLGDRRQGRWIMRVDRQGPNLYEVVLSDSATRMLVLRTSLFRPEETHATP